MGLVIFLKMRRPGSLAARHVNVTMSFQARHYDLEPAKGPAVLLSGEGSWAFPWEVSALNDRQTGRTSKRGGRPRPWPATCAGREQPGCAGRKVTKPF
jgi:hypothetical protein